MIRFALAMSLVSLGSLTGSPAAIGQEPPKADSPAKELVEEVRGRILADLEESTDLEADEVKGQARPDYLKGTGTGPIARTRIYTIQRPVTQTKVWNRPFDQFEANFGLKLTEADDALRAQLEIPPNQGVVVVAVRPGKLGEQAGVKANDVFVSLGDKKATSASTVKKALIALGKEALEVKLIREGKPTRLSLVGPEHGIPAEAVQYWIGVPVSPVDATLRAHLSSLAAEVGLVVNDVVKGSPAEASGVQKHDILVSIGGKPLKSSEQMIGLIQASGGKPVPVEILRAGKPSTLTITPSQRTLTATVNFRANEHTSYVQFLAPQLGVQTTPELRYDLVIPSMTNQAPRLFGSGPIDLQLNLRGLQDKSEGSAPRIEAQLAELSGKIDEIRKILDGLRKPEGK